MKNPFIVGVTGGSGSGKTTFINLLLEKFKPTEICIISLDHYYKPRHLQPLDHNGICNYDVPESIDFEQFAIDLDELLSGREVRKMEYTFNNPNQKAKELVFTPSPILLLEGILLFSQPEISRRIGLKIFIETLEHLRIKRRLMRDLTERGYPIEETLYYIEHHVTPGYQKYVEPHKENADLVIPNNKDFHKVVDVVAAYLKTVI